MGTLPFDWKLNDILTSHVHPLACDRGVNVCLCVYTCVCMKVCVCVSSYGDSLVHSLT